MIRVSSVLLIDAEGNKVGIVPIQQAMDLAKEAGQDLVEVSPEARPPVCKVMDYGKFKYLQKRKQKGKPKKGHQSQIKEIRLRPKTETHDLEVKCRQCKEFLSKGDKVLVNMILKGRELGNVELGRQNMLRFAEMVEDIAAIESLPSQQGRRMMMTLRKK